MDLQELEVKLLELDDNIHDKLLSLGCTYNGEVKQKIYTYDCYNSSDMYKLSVMDYERNKNKYSKNKIINIFKQYEVVLTKEELDYIKSITSSSSLEDYILNEEIDINVLLDSKLISIIEDSNNRFFKWIRLRQSNDKVELTLKYIYNTNKEYNIDDVKEIEIKCDNFEMANLLLEEMGYSKKKLVEKYRKSYTYNDLDIVIDSWPLIKPYMEIEGKKVEDIYDMVNKLGYKDEDAKIMNTDDIYLDNGINLDDYIVLTFEEQVKW